MCEYVLVEGGEYKRANIFGARLISLNIYLILHNNTVNRPREARRNQICYCLRKYNSSGGYAYNFPNEALR